MQAFLAFEDYRRTSVTEGDASKAHLLLQHDYRMLTDSQRPLSGANSVR